MIWLLSKPVLLPIRPQNRSTIELTDQLSIYLNQSPDNFTIRLGNTEIPYDHIDDTQAFITSSTFTIELYWTDFTFSTSRDYFTLRDFCECILTAWQAPLTEQQVKNNIDMLGDVIYEDTEGVARLSKIYPPTTLNGVGWSEGKYVHEEMQD